MKAETERASKHVPQHRPDMHGWDKAHLHLQISSPASLHAVRDSRAPSNPVVYKNETGAMKCAVGTSK